MKRGKVAAIGLIGALVVSTGLAVTVTGWEVGETGDSAGLRTLQQQHRQTLHELVLTVDQHFRTGRVSSDAVIQAKNNLLAAELDMAATGDQRLGLHRRMIGNFQDLERTAAERYRMGTTTQDEVLRARAARLHAEIQLIRERNRTD